MYGFKMAAKWKFLLRDKNFPAQNWKTTFPKEFFLKIWHIIEECKYNNIAEIKLQKSYSVTILGQKQICNSATNLPKYANYQYKDTIDLNFFRTKISAAQS